MKRLFHKLLQSLNFNGRDWTVFLLSLLLAFSIWMIHNLSLDYSDLIRVRVRATSNIVGHSSSSANVCEVVARCKTSGYDILRSRLSGQHKSLDVYFDKSALHEKNGEIYYISTSELTEYSHLIYGEKVALDYFIADTLFFRFPYETFKKVPVHPVSVLDFDSQYMSQGNLRVEPDSVLIYGEPFHLDNIDKVFTETIKLENLRTGTAGVAELEGIRGVRLSEETVHYTIDVTRFVEIRRDITLQVKNVPADKEMMIYPSRANVVFRCVFPLISDLSAVSLYIDYNDFVNSISRKCMPKATNLPDGIIEYKIIPEVFECVVADK